MRRLTLLSLLTLTVFLLLAAGCSHNKPTQSTALDSTDHAILPKHTDATVGPDQLYGRAGEVLPSAETIILRRTRTEVSINADASIALADHQAGTTAPLTFNGIKPGDSLELQGTYLSYGSNGPAQGKEMGGTGKDAETEGGYSPAVFLADRVTVVIGDTANFPPDTLPVGLSIAVEGVLKTVNLDQGSFTFTDRPYVGQTTLETVYSGMFMSPTITLANFAPGMSVRVVGKTAGNWALAVDSLIQRSSTPPDSGQSPDTMPINTPLQFYSEITSVDNVAHTVRFMYWPYTGDVTENTKIVITSLIECATMRDCVWPGMKVQVFGRTAGNWVLTLDSLFEQPAPPDSTNPPDSTIPPDSLPIGIRGSFDGQIQRTDTLHGLVWFNGKPFTGRVTPSTYYNGEFLPGTIPSLANFLPGAYVHVSGVFDSASLVIDTLILNDFVPPDSTIPPDSTRPGDTGYVPITGTIFFDLDAYHYDADSMGHSGWAVDLRMQTEELFSCPSVAIANTVERTTGGANFGILGVTPFECIAYEPGPATRQMTLKFDSVAFVISFTYMGKVDRYGVYVDPTYHVTITPFGAPTFTARKEL